MSWYRLPLVEINASDNKEPKLIFIENHMNMNSDGVNKKRPASAGKYPPTTTTNTNSKRSIQWKKDLVIEHVYSPTAIISTLNTNTNANMRNTRNNSDLALKNKNNSGDNGELVRAQRILSASTINNRGNSSNSNK